MTHARLKTVILSFSVVVSVGIGLVTNILTDEFSLAAVAFLVTLVLCAIALQVASSTLDRSARADTPTPADVGREVEAPGGGHPLEPVVALGWQSGSNNSQTTKITKGMPPGHVVVMGLSPALVAVVILAIVVVLNPRTDRVAHSDAEPKTTITSGGAQPSSAVPVAVQVEDDLSKLRARLSQWAVPAETPFPEFQSNCLGLNDWAVKQRSAVAMDNVIRVTVTGRSDEPVVVQGIRPTVVARDDPPAAWKVVSCPQGGPLPYTTATVDLDEPSRVTYADDQQRELPRLAYSLARNEAAVFYVQTFNERSKKFATWDVILETTVGEREVLVNVNEVALGGRHFRSATSCGLPQYQYAGRWEDVGASC